MRARKALIVSEPTGAEIIAARHRRILELARRAGSVSIDDLAERMAVTPQTIRKDLNILARRSMLSRVHGGAIITSGVDNIDYAARRTGAMGAKTAIGAAAAALIPDGASLFINIGTTTEAVAASLVGHRDLMVFSNNLNVVDLLSGRSGIEMIVVGGEVRSADRAVADSTQGRPIRAGTDRRHERDPFFRLGPVGGRLTANNLRARRRIGDRNGTIVEQ